MTDTVEPITRGERALGNVLLHQPCGGFSQLDIGPYKIGIAITTEDGEQDPEKAGEALEEFVRRAVASEAREKRLQVELDALIAALRASEERIKKLEEALNWVMIGGNHLATHIGPDHPPFTASTDDAINHYGVGKVFDMWCCWQSIMRARQALGE